MVQQFKLKNVTLPFELVWISLDIIINIKFTFRYSTRK